MPNITIKQHDIVPIEEQEVEYVERKGKGHPDSLIDGIVERCSIELCKQYIERAGAILHYNVDKGLIVGGSSEATFGRGEITKPIEIIIAGRATQQFKGEEIPVDEIAINSVYEHLKENTRFLNLEREIVVVPKILKGSHDLEGVFKSGVDVPLANDTSFGMGFAPFTETERLVLETEHYLNDAEYKKVMPAVGEDIKVMGIKEGNEINLTIAIAFVSHLTPDIEAYKKFKARVVDDVKRLSSKYTKRNVSIVVNNGDEEDKGIAYLTKSGLSCEAGDDGEVGRGNRVNGLITPFRNMTLEAASGKNPVSHVGKIYNILANEIAADVIKLYPQIKDCSVSIVSQIGRPINDPKNLCINLIMEDGQKADPIIGKVKAIAEESLSNIALLTHEIAEGKHKTY
jgi:S-adenosylmethionine synthetase